MKGVILDFNRTLFNPEQNCFEEGTLSLLTTIRKKKWKAVLVSIGTDERKEQIKPIADYFDLILMVEDKTEACFQEIVTAMNLIPSELLVIGDRIPKEIILGKSLGMKTVWLKKGKFATEIAETDLEKPDYIFTSLEEIGCGTVKLCPHPK